MFCWIANGEPIDNVVEDAERTCCDGTCYQGNGSFKLLAT